MTLRGRDVIETYSFIGFSEPFSSWSHLIAAVAFLYMGYPLIKKGLGNRLRVFSLSIFTFSLVFLFSMSGVFHLLEGNTLGWEVLMRLDHAAIWVLIAGSLHSSSHYIIPRLLALGFFTFNMDRSHNWVSAKNCFFCRYSPLGKCYNVSWFRLDGCAQCLESHTPLW